LDMLMYEDKFSKKSKDTKDEHTVSWWYCMFLF
jgi:hypothetical protein